MPEYTEAELKTLLSGYPEEHPKHERASRPNLREKKKRRAKNKQARKSRKKNR